MLRDYQKKVLKNFPSALFWEMRLGKTKTIHEHIKINCLYPCLIVCPYSAFDSWIKEIPNIAYQNTQKHPKKQQKTGEGMVKSLFPRITYQSKPKHPKNTPKQATEQQKTGEGMVKTLYAMTNKESFLKLPIEFFMQFKSIVLDESTFIKNPKSKVSRFFCNKVKKFIPYRFILTGTPNPESDLDFIQQLYFIDALHIDYWKFRFRYCYPIVHQWFLNKAGKLIIQSALKKHCHFLSQCDVHLQNEKEKIIREVMPSKEWLKIYKMLKDKFVLEYKTYQKETSLFIQQFLLMRNLCSGFVNNKMEFSFKFEELKYLLDTELKGQQIIIYCDYLNELKYLYKHIPFSDFICGEVNPFERIERIKNFRNGKIKYMFIQPNTVKYGNDFSFCDTIIYFSSPLGSESRIQSEARIDMPNKKNKNLIIDLIIKNSIERDILISLKQKENRQLLIKRLINS